MHVKSSSYPTWILTKPIREKTCDLAADGSWLRGCRFKAWVQVQNLRRQFLCTICEAQCMEAFVINAIYYYLILKMGGKSLWMNGWYLHKSTKAYMSLAKNLRRRVGVRNFFWRGGGQFFWKFPSIFGNTFFHQKCHFGEGYHDKNFTWLGNTLSPMPF